MEQQTQNGITAEEPLNGIGNNANNEDFRMKNQIYEIIKYGNIALKDFPRCERPLADEIRRTMLNALRLVIALEDKHYKKTTLGELDIEVDTLRHLIRLAADKDMYPNKKPCISMRRYEIWVKLVNDLGRQIGKYDQYLNGASHGRRIGSVPGFRSAGRVSTTPPMVAFLPSI